MKKIVLTGGGSAGHVTPNLALKNLLEEQNWNIEYIGSTNGIEKQIVKDANISYHGISSGKLRRYFSVENFTDLFKVFIGIIQAYFLIKKLKPSITFSKGGFVTVPVIIGSYLNKVPVIIHESDMTPGLANKISMRFAKKICTSFPETLKYLPKEKSIYTGSPIRKEITQGKREKGLSFLGFNTSKPVLLVIGGSLGSEVLNNSIREILDTLSNEFQIVHVCGKGNVKTDLETNTYKQFEYLNQEISDVIACSDIVVSRAGANAIFEFLATKKPNLLIPLSKKASRGDQILNAESFKKSSFSMVIQEEELNSDILLSSINELFKNKDVYVNNMITSPAKDAVSEIINIINEYKK